MGNSNWSSPRWPDTSTKSAFDVREWTQRVGKESCWEGNDREESSRMSSNVDAVEIVRSSGKPVRQVANELGIYDSTLGSWVRQDGINRGPPASDVAYQQPIMEDPFSFLVDSDPPWQIPYSPPIREEPEYVDWFNHRRLLEPIGDIPPTRKGDQLLP